MSGNNGQTPKGKPIISVMIDVFPDISVEVRNFPVNYHQAMEIMTAGVQRVSNHFMAMGLAGKLDEKMTIKKDMIVKPSMGMVSRIGGPH